MSSPIVEQVTEGLVVRCADGTEVRCRPLLLGEAMPLINLYRQAYDPVKTPFEKGEARLAIVERFAKCYPELADHIAAADVEQLVPDFFWSATGAAVVRPPTPETPSNGTPSGAPTSPSGASSPDST